MSMIPEFDSSRLYLGSLCKRGHDWNNTGQSLRRRGNGGCTECERQSHNLSRAKDPEKARETRRKYRQENLESIKQRDRLYREANRDRLLQGKKEYYQNNKQKHREWGREYRQQNLEKLATYHKLYEQENKEKLRLGRQDWRRRNPDKRSAASARYNLNHREQRRINLCNYRARKRQVHHHPYTTEQIEARIQQFDCCCAYCGKQLELGKKGWVHMDHFLPISSGGSDTIGNIIPSCIKCNSGKCGQDPYAWFRSMPFWDEERWRKILKVLGKTQATYNQLTLF